MKKTLLTIGFFYAGLLLALPTPNSPHSNQEKPVTLKWVTSSDITDLLNKITLSSKVSNKEKISPKTLNHLVDVLAEIQNSRMACTVTDFISWDTYTGDVGTVLAKDKKGDLVYVNVGIIGIDTLKEMEKIAVRVSPTVMILLKNNRRVVFFDRNMMMDGKVLVENFHQTPEKAKEELVKLNSEILGIAETQIWSVVFAGSVPKNER
jgi:hypothetical protein